MHLQEEEKNRLTGILGTLAVHLAILIVFLIARIDKVKSIHQEAMVIEFDEEVFKTLQELQEEIKSESAVEPLSQQDIKNIAVNTANRMEEQISTEKYIEELKQELDIEDLNQQLPSDIDEEALVPVENKQNKKEEEKKSYSGPTRISYDLGGRGHRYIYRPIYRCQGNGRVVIDIVVNPEGEVISAGVANSNTDEICITETALESARRSLFAIDLNAGPKQRGTITYEFVAQ